VHKELKECSSNATNKLLNKISDQKNLPPIDSEIKFEEFCKALKKWREETSTSPSNRHLGHLKVLLVKEKINHKRAKGNNGSSQDQHHENPEEPDPDEFESEEPDYDEINEKILRVHYHIMTATFNSGNTLPRWCNSTTLMIEKTPGCPRIDKLRVIHLY
jgi:hypothetical protein